MSRSLSIQSIASQYSLPIVIRPALGFRGSDQAIVLHSIVNITFAYGRVLNRHRNRESIYEVFRPSESEIVAIPLNYPGLFGCVQSSSPNDGIQPENSFASIIERMENDYRPQRFYIDHPLHAYTLEMNSKNEWNRIWKDLDANQLITFEELTYVEYTPTENDILTAADYGYFWWFCLSKRVLAHQMMKFVYIPLDNKAQQM